MTMNRTRYMLHYYKDEYKNENEKSTRRSVIQALLKTFNGENFVEGEGRHFFAYKTASNEKKHFDDTHYPVLDDMNNGRITIEAGLKLLADAGVSKIVELDTCYHCNKTFEKTELIESHDEYLCQKCFDPEYLEYDEDCECSKCDARRDNNN